MGQAYVNFMRNCMDQIRSKVLDELWILTFFEVKVKIACKKLFNCYLKINFGALTHSHYRERFRRIISIYVCSNGTRRRYKCYVIGCPRDLIIACICINVLA